MSIHGRLHTGLPVQPHIHLFHRSSTKTITVTSPGYAVEGVLLSRCFTFTETIRIIRGGRMETGEEGDST